MSTPSLTLYEQGVRDGYQDYTTTDRGEQNAAVLELAEWEEDT